MRIASAISSALNADLERIESALNREGALGYALSAAEALAKGLPSIQTSANPADYDLVVLGSPVWAGTLSSPMRSYLFLHREQLKQRALGFFACMGGRGAEAALREMKMLCNAEDSTPTQAFVQRQVESYSHRTSLQAFVEALQRPHAPTALDYRAAV